MDWLQTWVLNIVTFLLAAFLLELLLPATSYQKYIRLLLSFILILLILDPVITIVKGDADQAWRVIEESEQIINMEASSSENLMENKKNEIESGQDAYIVEQVSEDLKNQVNEDVEKKWGWSISALTAEWRNEEKHQEDLLITVELTEKERKSEQSTVEMEPVDIDIEVGENSENEESDTAFEDIHMFLADQWGVSKTQISISAEEGGARE